MGNHEQTGGEILRTGGGISPISLYVKISLLFLKIFNFEPKIVFKIQ